MKKSIRKLTLRGETIRTLRTLDLQGITPARGGNDSAPQFESTGTCPGIGDAASAALPCY